MPRLTFHEVHPAFHLKHKIKIRTWILDVVTLHNRRCEDLQFIFCTDDYLLELNRKYLKHDTYTDVITFNYNREEIIAGEIYISIDRIAENAERYNKPFYDELCRVMIHGVLHLLGFNDKTQAQRTLIRSREDRMLEKLEL